MIANYHTHTRWCRHGGGEIEEYIQEALANGLKELAITEHVPLLGDPDPRRLFCDEFPAFDAELNQLIEKYAGQIIVRKGFECEYYPNQLDHYREYREKFGYEILILGHHTNQDRSIDNFGLTMPWQLDLYASDVEEALETSLFTFIAHPDLIFRGYQRFDAIFQSAIRRIFQTCERLSIPVEINGNGWHYRRGYPEPRVWTELAPGYKLQCLVSSDAHEVADLCHKPTIPECEDLALRSGLTLLQYLPKEESAVTAPSTTVFGV